MKVCAKYNILWFLVENVWRMDKKYIQYAQNIEEKFS